ncbi:MAG: protocatechuate 3,4-dioxygenase subunit beta [Kiloniellaceae bacterium]
MTQCSRTTRRALLTGGLALAGLAAVRPATAALLPTPRQTEGPFYPTRIPLDSDADLVRVAGRPAPAAGTVTHVFGRVLTEDGRPKAGVRVEVWQCDAFGRYHHPREPRGRADPNFQGYGRVTAAADGAYRFRTIRPVPYPGRTPHIHFAVSGPGMGRLTTQMYVAGEPGNARDFVLNRVPDPRARASLIVALAPVPEIEAGALVGRFDIVLGRNLLNI